MKFQIFSDKGKPFLLNLEFASHRGSLLGGLESQRQPVVLSVERRDLKTIFIISL